MATILETLKFVRGAVAKKDLLPAMTHFCIEGGTVRAYNGTLALGAPIECDLDCKPRAAQLIQAITNCDKTVTLSLTTAGRLAVRSGKFKAFVECSADPIVHATPSGDNVDIDGAAILAAAKVLEPLICTDQARAWSTGMLLAAESAYATNNVVLVQYWIKARIPVAVNIPRLAVIEMLRIGEAPTHAQLDAHSMTFHYSGSRWLRTQLLETKWPDVDTILSAPSNQVDIDPKFFKALALIRPFCDRENKAIFSAGKVRTHIETGEGASHEVPGIASEGVFRLGMLQLLEGVAKRADFSAWPQPCLFEGDNLRGAVVGLRS